jgi:signal transduction histidine kinase/ActR/RegA family two-component response regulator
LLHRLSALVLVVVSGATLAAHQAVQHLVDQHEHDLLLREADDLTVLLQQLGSSYASSIAGVAAIAEVTDGDAEEFAMATAKAETGGAWSLLRVTPEGLATVSTVGEVAIDLNQPPEDWQEGIARAVEDEFAVLGLAGTGTNRHLGMASGAGDFVIYDEIPLFSAAAQSIASAEPDDDDDRISEEAAAGFLDLDFAMYVGPEPTEEGFLFQTEAPGADAVQQVVDIGGSQITLVIGTSNPLGGSLIGRWPVMVLALGAAIAIGLVTSLELASRRRDDALRQVRRLARQNAALDTALRDRERAEAATVQLESELRQMQRLESVGQLAGGVAHDFNNLLAAILSYADLLGDDLGDQGNDDLEEIRRAARRGADLTRRLLQFSRQDHDEVAVVDVSGLITELSRLLERTIGEDVTLQTRLNEDPCPVLADSRSLEQVVLNLVINARDAAGPGGTITITTACVDVDGEEAARLPGIEPGPHVLLSVTDDGTGMTDEVIRRAFDPFFTTKGRAQGTGLGLATVYGTVQGFHGHVGIASTVGAGTQVTVLIPRADAELAPPLVPPPTTESRSHAGRVLVVEDEPAVRAAMRRMLERAGYEVAEASDGHHAIDEHATTDIDLVVTDVVMPGSLNGADVAEHLRVRRPGLPVLFVTGYGADLLAQRGVSVDGITSSVLHKPFSEAELLAAVGAILDGALR